MARKAQKAWTPSADIRWDGALPLGFRNRVDQIYGRSVTDEEWTSFSSVVRGYSIWLNHEHAAAPLSEQKAAVQRTINATDELQSAIDAANTEENGQVISARVAARWEELYPLESEHERNLTRMAQDLTEALGPGADAEDRAWQMLRGWQTAGRIVRPSQPADFVIELHTFRQALRLVGRGLEDGTEPKTVEGDAWVDFIGRLTEWARSAHLSAYVTKKDEAPSRFVQLVIAINEAIPDTLDDYGVRSETQMRRPTVQPASWARNILEARKLYERRRPPSGD